MKTNQYHVELSCLVITPDKKILGGTYQITGQEEIVSRIVDSLMEGDDNLKRIDPRKIDYLRGLRRQGMDLREVERGEVIRALHNYRGFVGLRNVWSYGQNRECIFETYSSDPHLEVLLASCNRRGRFRLEPSQGCKVTQVGYNARTPLCGGMPNVVIPFDEYLRMKKPTRLRITERSSLKIEAA